MSELKWLPIRIGILLTSLSTVALLSIGCSNDIIDDSKWREIWPDSMVYRSISELPTLDDSAIELLLPGPEDQQNRFLGAKLSGGQTLWSLGSTFGIYGVELLDPYGNLIYREEFSLNACRISFASGDAIEYAATESDTFFALLCNFTSPMSRVTLRVGEDGVTLDSTNTKVFEQPNASYGVSRPPSLDVVNRRSAYQHPELTCDESIMMAESTIKMTCLVQDWAENLARETLKQSCRVTETAIGELLKETGASARLRVYIGRLLKGVCNVAGGGTDWSGWLDILSVSTRANPLKLFCSAFSTINDVYKIWQGNGTLEDFAAWLCGGIDTDETAPDRWEPPTNWNLPGLGTSPEDCGWRWDKLLTVKINGAVGEYGVGGNAKDYNIYGGEGHWGSDFRIRYRGSKQAGLMNTLTLYGTPRPVISCLNGETVVSFQSRAKIGVLFYSEIWSDYVSCGFDGNAAVVLHDRQSGSDRISVFFESSEKEAGFPYCDDAEPVSGNVLEGNFSEGGVTIE